jgi:hypothetical protein
MGTAGVTNAGRAVAVNALGVVEHPSFATSHPYEIDVDGRPYVPTGLGGVVLGVRLGDGVAAFDTDQVAPGLTLVHPDPAARAALTALSCIGNVLTVRTGAAAGAVGAVSGKRGEEGRVLGVFAQDVLAVMRPGDQIAVATRGQGARPAGFPDGVALLNIDPDLLPALGIAVADGVVGVPVAATVASRQIGNGIGRPAHQWDLALYIGPADPLRERLRLGDLVAVTDLDARYNVGFRRGWCTVGVVVSGCSPLPGHGPGLTPILSGPADSLRAVTNGQAGRLTEELLGIGAPTGPRADTVER